MTDSIHKKRNKKDYPHFDKFFVYGKAYSEGYDRIFGKKKKKSKKRKVKNGVQ